MIPNYPLAQKFSPVLERRKRLVGFIEVIRSNPNGDPDNRGRPRRDLWNHGIMTSACVKRPWRDYVQYHLHTEVYCERDADSREKQTRHGKPGKTPAENAAACVKAQWDMRSLGGPLTQYNARITGALQVTDARSLTEIDFETISLTRVLSQKTEVAVDKTKTTRDVDGDTEIVDRGNMGSRQIVPYAVYRFDVTYDASRALRNGLSVRDLEMFFEALVESGEFNRSAARPAVNLRRVYMFDGPLGAGTEPSHVTAARVRTELITPKDGMGRPALPEKWSDYTFNVDTVNLPAGTTLAIWSDGQFVS